MSDEQKQKNKKNRNNKMADEQKQKNKRLSKTISKKYE